MMAVVSLFKRSPSPVHHQPGAGRGGSANTLSFGVFFIFVIILMTCASVVTRNYVEPVQLQKKEVAKYKYIISDEKCNGN